MPTSDITKQKKMKTFMEIELRLTALLPTGQLRAFYHHPVRNRKANSEIEIAFEKLYSAIGCQSKYFRRCQKT